MPPKGAKKIAPKAHKLAEQFPKGLVLKDLFKKEWVLGDVVGKGGFGLIYSATQKDAKAKSDYVVKIEPKNNGPLFCESQFYQRIARSETIKSFVTENKIQYLPVPEFIGQGSCEFKTAEYRFLVMPRYGTDLHKLLMEAGGVFPAVVVFAVGLRVLDALQFMHVNEYVHADVKAANILQGFQQGKCLTNQIYLVDYGLAYRYTVDGVHKVYKEDPRKAHDGTIEYTSRDAHKGVSPSRRADLEILSYCLLQWLCGQLPWENKLTDPAYVASCKEKFMKSVSSSVSSCFSGTNPNSAYSNTVSKFIEMVKNLAYDETPNYVKLKSILKDGLTKAGQKNEWIINFTSETKASTTKRKSAGEASSPAKKAKTSPTKSPKKSAKTKTVTPLTPKSPAKSPTKSPLKPINGRAKPCSSAKKAKTSPTKSPKRSAKTKTVTPLTPKSPAKSPTKSPLKPINGRAKPKKTDNKSTTKPKAVKKKAVVPPLDTPLTRHLTNGAGEGSSSLTASGVRKVKKRVGVVQSDMSIQTSPSLAKTKKTS